MNDTCCYYTENDVKRVKELLILCREGKMTEANSLKFFIAFYQIPHQKIGTTREEIDGFVHQYFVGIVRENIEMLHRKEFENPVCIKKYVKDIMRDYLVSYEEVEITPEELNSF